MRNFIVAFILISAALIFLVVIVTHTPTANAGIWEKLSSLGDETVSTTSFTIEAKGWNLRGYMFKIPNSRRECLFVAGERKGGLTCWHTQEATN